MKKFIIRKMLRPDLDFAINLAEKEGWNPGIHDADCFYNTDPNGFFIGELDGLPVGCISAVSYNSSFGFVGFFIVKPEFRGKLYGIYLAKQAMAYMGMRNIGVDGVIAKVPHYEKYGFKFAYKNIRYEGIAKNNILADKNSVELSKVPFDVLAEYDNKIFPANRSKFLKQWIVQPEGSAIAIIDNNKISGYGVLRKCKSGFKIGPLFADNFQIAESIFAVLCKKINGQIFYLDIPEINKDALSLVNKYNMKKIFETARMYNKAFPDLPINCIYGVTSFELG